MTTTDDIDRAACEALGEALDDVWAPWTPKVGDQVAIHRSAECPHRYEFMHAEHLADGTVGVVWQDFDVSYGEKTWDQHDILVAFGTDAEGRTDVSWFAASELIPLPPSPDQEPQPDETERE